MDIHNLCNIICTINLFKNHLPCIGNNSDEDKLWILGGNNGLNSSTLVSGKGEISSGIDIPNCYACCVVTQHDGKILLLGKTL